jgi:hypothetical protein
LAEAAWRFRRGVLGGLNVGTHKGRPYYWMDIYAQMYQSF